MCGHHLASFCISEGIAMCVVAHSVCPSEEENLGASSVAILEHLLFILSILIHYIYYPTESQIIPSLAIGKLSILAPEFFCHHPSVFDSFIALWYTKVFQTHHVYFRPHKWLSLIQETLVYFSGKLYFKTIIQE